MCRFRVALFNVVNVVVIVVVVVVIDERFEDARTRLEDDSRRVDAMEMVSGDPFVTRFRRRRRRRRTGS